MAKKENKKWWESRTLWVGVLTVATAALTAATTGEAGWREGLIAAIGAVNILLRTQTDTGITK